MKAEIGIFEGHPYLEVTAQSQTEYTTLKHFAQALGMNVDESSYGVRLYTRGPSSECSDCKLLRAAHGVKCLEHTLPEERAARAKAIGVVR